MIKVQVLLSTYNGERYIKQLLDSIFHQKGVEVHCLVRDDGSTDNTLSILHQYQNKYQNIIVINENNIGYKASFMKLVEMSGEYDYYAFADQDDVWKPEKLLKAIEKINNIEHNHIGNHAVMYCSNCIVVDNNLKYLGMLFNKKNVIPNNKLIAIVQGFAIGCTMVFNHESRKLILKYIPKKEYAHDFWIPLLHIFFGDIVYDEYSYIFYRQHEDNIFGSDRSIIKKINIKMKFLKNKHYYTNLIQDILNGYGDILDLEDKLMLKDILDYKNKPYKKIKLLFNKQIKRKTIIGTLFLKLLILLSRF